MNIPVHTSGGAFEASIQQALGRIQGDAESLGGKVAPLPGQAAGGGLGQSFQDALHRMNDKDVAASEKMAAVDSGQSDDLVGAMLASQDASLSFSMLMQVRNKVMGAMDELIKLQL